MGCFINYNLCMIIDVKEADFKDVNNNVRDETIRDKTIRDEKSRDETIRDKDPIPNLKYKVLSKSYYKLLLRRYLIDDVIEIILSYLNNYDNICKCIIHKRYTLYGGIKWIELEKERKEVEKEVENNTGSESMIKSNIENKTLYTIEICNNCLMTISNKYNILNSNKKNYIDLFIGYNYCNILISNRIIIKGMNNMIKYNIVKKEYKKHNTKLFIHMLEYYLPDTHLNAEIKRLTAFKQINIIIR